MSFDYVRKSYGVPAKRGQRITFAGFGEPVQGEIRATAGNYIRVRFDGSRSKRLCTLHPTWKVGYHEGGAG